MDKGYTFHSKEEKLRIVKRYLAGESPKRLYEETGISDGNIRKWKRQYQAGGESALENKKKPGNPLTKYERCKELTREEQLEYQVELLKRELMKKEAEVVRLKKSIELEGGGIRRK
ncbi:helix-turn-helix domain-containing protein [Lacrimispora sp.]|uniref:helix-turn-helix domain-containing protein n=1 Tax=Lacrimispora sp. TaxID=2719234 RepID=UPI0028AB6F68|nr:helix-turn-helix domain-containing protein [Lacrimispora sp.]